MFLSAMFIAVIHMSNVRIKLGVGGLLSTGYIQCCNLVLIIKTFMYQRMFMN